MHQPLLTGLAPRADRHDPDDVQLNVRVPRTLRSEFRKTCADQNIKPAAVVRVLLQGFIDISQGQSPKDGHGQA